MSAWDLIVLWEDIRLGVHLENPDMRKFYFVMALHNNLWKKLLLQSLLCKNPVKRQKAKV